MPQSNNMRYGNPSFKSLDCGNATIDTVKLINNGLASFALPFIQDSNTIVRIDPNIKIYSYDPAINGALWIDGNSLRVSTGNLNSVGVSMSLSQDYVIKNKYTVITTITNTNASLYLPSPASFTELVINNKTNVSINLKTNDGSNIEGNTLVQIPSGNSVTLYFIENDRWYIS